ncbi:MAG: hypothetical protein K0R00_39 [Herbinix sp.]|jgi:hypothetical protein|nr:hypothetical protein [Herbinix sp.]
MMVLIGRIFKNVFGKKMQVDDVQVLVEDHDEIVYQYMKTNKVDRAAAEKEVNKMILDLKVVREKRG